MYCFGLIFLSLLYLSRVKCYTENLPVSCTGTVMDRFCALDNPSAEADCELELGLQKDFKIFDYCFNAMIENGKSLSTAQKIEKLCKLKFIEYNGINLCYTYALNLDLKRGGRILKGADVSVLTCKIVN
ncbi:uncharacterized protein LOC111636411 [Centruroides sculpturatus]|uniref:uncharacterized protein LOC111636411 n=1 Tax=Centruroides sculpturatus TaxID=218467 RepID=UPI000C6CDDD6|nr:uncharacterized protein LOC111636411 [Centruroides sculpturatus]